jgi:hypothetical protein
MDLVILRMQYSNYYKIFRLSEKVEQFMQNIIVDFLIIQDIFEVEAFLLTVNFFLNCEISSAQICADLLELRIDKKKQMRLDVNKIYCQSCHLISQNRLSLRK